MKQIVEIEIEPTPEDIAREVAEINMYWQTSFIYQLAKICYNHPNQFNMRMKDIAEDIKNNYSYDARIMIKRMVSEINSYLGEDNNADNI